MKVGGVSSREVLAILACLLGLIAEIVARGEVIWAVNCGGEGHTDIHGIRYQKDFAADGIASDYGKSLMIQRVVPQDQILYQTERYHISTFGYEFPVKGDADYVLVLKFSEVWFTAPNKKVFDIVLNGVHSVVSNLDIFAEVGRGVGHDEIIPFSVKGGKVRIDGQEPSTVKGNKVSVQFIKGEYDNPKINAMYVMKGSVEDVPRLPPLPGMPEGNNNNNNNNKPPPGEPQIPREEEDEEEEADELLESTKKAKKNRRPSGPKVQDPYAADDTSSMLLPMFVAIGAFIPLLFCLCKL